MATTGPRPDKSTPTPSPGPFQTCSLLAETCHVDARVQVFTVVLWYRNCMCVLLARSPRTSLSFLLELSCTSQRPNYHFYCIASRGRKEKPRIAIVEDWHPQMARPHDARVMENDDVRCLSRIINECGSPDGGA
eukprot:360719-Chlamydomonas_euryale.AAC.15